jgi:hypothetical protein
MRSIIRKVRSLVLLAVLVSSLFASSVLANSGITASGERYTDGKDNDLKTVSVEFKNVPAEYEGWQAGTSESMPVCGVVTNGVVSCEFRNEGPVSGAWLHLFKKGTDQHVSFYVSFYVPGMKKSKPVEENNCESFQPPTFLCVSQCCPQ